MRTTLEDAALEYARDEGWVNLDDLDHKERMAMLADWWEDQSEDEKSDFYLNDKEWLLEYVVPLLREDDTARYHDDMHHEGTVRWCTDAYCKGEANV